MIKNKPRTLSHSQIEVFLNCERRWYYERIARLPQPPAPQLEIGSLYHSVIEGFLRARLRNPNIHLIEFPWEELGLNQIAAMAGEDPDILRVEILTNLQRLDDVLLHRLKPQEVERRFTWPLLHFSGRLDLISNNAPIIDSNGNVIGVEDRPCVLDWKIKFSNRNRRTQQAADDSDQLAIYAIEADVDLAGFVEIPRDTSRPIKTFTTEIGPADKDRVIRWVASQCGAVRSRGEGEYAYRLAARNNPLCSARWCPFHKHCPGGKGESIGQNQPE